VKPFLYALILFVAADACLLNIDFSQCLEEDEVEFYDIALETAHELSIQVGRRPWAAPIQVAPDTISDKTLTLNSSQHEPRCYSTTPAEVAVNSDA